MPEKQEALVNLTFPNLGIGLATEFHEQVKGTTPLGNNVRAFDMLKRRMRGGSRPALSKYIDAQPEGANLIQHLNTVAWSTSEATWENYLLDLDFNFGFEFGYQQYFGDFAWLPGTEMTVDPRTGLTVRVGGSFAQAVQPQGQCEITYRQSTSQGFAQSPLSRSVAYGTPVLSGSLLVVCFAKSGGTGTDTVAVTDSIGNTYEQADDYASNGAVTVSVWWAITSSGGDCTVTCNPSDAESPPQDPETAIAILEYRCVATSPVEGTVLAESQTGSSLTTGTIPVLTLARKVLLFGAFAHDDDDELSFTPDSGIIRREQILGEPDTIIYLYVADRIATSSGEAITGTVTQSVDWCSVGVCFGPH